MTNDRVFPVTVIFDSNLTLFLPVGLSVASELKGMAHCIDFLWGPRANASNAALSAEGTRALAEGLPKIVEDPTGLDGRDQAFYGAYLALISLSSAGSGTHHKLCHVLGGIFTLLSIPANNPRTVTSENLTELFHAALTGEDPAVLIRETVCS